MHPSGALRGAPLTPGKEEDFVTNTYHRSLLDNLDRDEIRDDIMAARKTLHSLRHTMTDEMADALGFRLELRTAFLRAIELTELRSNPDSLSLPWSQMCAVWEAINKSRHLGTSVPEAFSTKIQRRLASTMPPRPIVQPSPEETHAHFAKLFADAIDVLNVLNHTDSQSLMVCCPCPSVKEAAGGRRLIQPCTRTSS